MKSLLLCIYVVLEIACKSKLRKSGNRFYSKKADPAPAAPAAGADAAAGADTTP